MILPLFTSECDVEFTGWKKSRQYDKTRFEYYSAVLSNRSYSSNAYLLIDETTRSFFRTRNFIGSDGYIQKWKASCRMNFYRSMKISFIDDGNIHFDRHEFQFLVLSISLFEFQEELKFEAF